jgi:AhpD family alkylhydroperoxidase
MTPRLNPFMAAPGLMNSWFEFGKGLLKCGLDPKLMELVKIRASQINGCAACLQMHTASAIKGGETQERLLLLEVWQETTLYSERERAALLWTETLTRLAETHAPDSAYSPLKEAFSEEEQVALTLLIVTINGWNRLQVGFRAQPAIKDRQAA